MCFHFFSLCFRRRSDPRPIIEYRDLDAPDEMDIFWTLTSSFSSLFARLFSSSRMFVIGSRKQPKKLSSNCVHWYLHCRVSCWECCHLQLQSCCTFLKSHVLHHYVEITVLLCCVHGAVFVDRDCHFGVRVRNLLNHHLGSCHQFTLWLLASSLNFYLRCHKFLSVLSQVWHSALVRSDLTDETVEVAGFALGLVSSCVRMECGFVLGSPSR